VIKNTIQDRARPENRDTQGLEFVRRLNRRAVVAVILTPPLLSAVAIIVWLAVYLRKPKKGDDTVDVQAVTTAAFTIAAYLVTAGEYWIINHLTTGLIALSRCFRDGIGSVF
jgi:hypothetical protein